MASLSEIVKGLFSSRSVSKVPLYSLRDKLKYWSSSRNYPSYYTLPVAISFSYEFWQRIKEIQRHTSIDGHERAIRVWWADDEFVVTESIRGEKARVNLPRQRVSVAYKPIKGTRRAERVVTVDGKVYSKREEDLESLKYKKKIEVSFICNLHTHPPHKNESTGALSYSFFSQTDIKSFMTSSAALTGVVTDVLWLIAKTDLTPMQIPAELSSIALTPEILTDQLKMKVFKAEYGRGAVVVRPDEVD